MNTTIKLTTNEWVAVTAKGSQNVQYTDRLCFLSPPQEAQWPKHMLTCANQQGNSAAAADGVGDDGGRGQTV